MVEFVTSAVALVIWLGLTDLLFFHIKIHILGLTTHQYILRRRAGESKLQIASSAWKSKVILPCQSQTHQHQFCVETLTGKNGDI